MDFESLWGFVAYVKAFAVAFGGKEYVILNAGVYRLSEYGLKGDGGFSFGQLSGASVLEPVLRRFHGIDLHLAGSCIHGNDSGHYTGAAQVAARIDVAISAVPIRLE